MFKLLKMQHKRKSLVKSLLKSEDGVTSIEFAILAPVFIILLIGLIEIGYHAIVQSDLDSMAYNFTLNIAITDDEGLTKQEIIDRMVCSEASLLLNCEKIEVGIDAYDRYTYFQDLILDDFSATWKTGCASATIVTQLNYPTKSFVLPFVLGDIISKNGQTFHRARGMTKREPGIVGDGQGSRGPGSNGLPC